MLTSEQQKIYNVKVPKGGYGYYTLYHGIYDPENDIDERPVYAQTGDLFEPEGSSVVYKATRRNGKTTWAIDENAQRQSESGEGGSGGGSSLPSMTGKNGKVLGVTLDAQDHEQAEWVTPSGGGGAEKFVVTLTADDSGAETVWTADKTIAEIVAADAAGKTVVATALIDKLNIELEFAKTVILSVEDDETTVSQAAFSATLCGEPDKARLFSVIGMNIGEGDEWDLFEANTNAELPSFDSSNNGKVLGVSSGELAWVDNYAPLIVTLTAGQEAGQYVGNMTFAEIHAAATAGRTVVFVVNIEGDEYVMYCISSSVVVESSNTVYQVYYINAGDIAHFDGGASDYPSLS